jgi:hypothetical protein
MGNEELEWKEMVFDCMVCLYSLYTMAELEIKWPAKRIQVFWLAQPRNDTKGEDVLVLGADHRW